MWNAKCKGNGCRQPLFHISVTLLSGRRNISGIQCPLHAPQNGRLALKRTTFRIWTEVPSFWMEKTEVVHPTQNRQKLILHTKTDLPHHSLSVALSLLIFVNNHASISTQVVTVNPKYTCCKMTKTNKCLALNRRIRNRNRAGYRLAASLMINIWD